MTYNLIFLRFPRFPQTALTTAYTGSAVLSAGVPPLISTAIRVSWPTRGLSCAIGGLRLLVDSVCSPWIVNRDFLSAT